MVYCTFEEFYEYADLDNDAVSTSLVSKHINRAYNEITNKIGYVVGSTSTDLISITETLDPTDNNSSEAVTRLVINNYPIYSLDAISLDGDNKTATDFVAKDDRIVIATNASVVSFGTNTKSVSVTYKSGVVDTYKYDLAKQLNIYSAILDFMTTPKGRDVMLDNSRYAEINQNNVRPNDMANLYITDLKSKVDKAYSELGVAHKFF